MEGLIAKQISRFARNLQQLCNLKAINYIKVFQGVHLTNPVCRMVYAECGRRCILCPLMRSSLRALMDRLQFVLRDNVMQHLQKQREKVFCWTTLSIA